MSDEKPLELRDKFAIEILNGLLCIHKELYSDYVNHHSSSFITKEMADNKAKRLITVAYQMADMMREIRLQVFK